MTVYVVAALDKTDEAGYADYVRVAQVSLLKYPDSRLAADDAPILVEGEAPAKRIILLQFKDQSTFEEWYASPEYQEAIPHRLGASDMKFLALVRGH